MKYKLKQNNEKKYAIFDREGKQVSKWFLYIDFKIFLKTGMRYYTAMKEDGKWAIFHIFNSDLPISQWWKKIIIKNKIIDYYLVKNKENRYAIFHISNPERPISQWHKKIIFNINNGYYMADQDRYLAIYSIKNSNKPVSKKWFHILGKGIIENEKSKYYIVTSEDKNYKQAIFSIDNAKDPISKWWYIIYPEGLVNGKNNFYIAQNNDGKIAVFHKNNPSIPIINWSFLFKDVKRILLDIFNINLIRC